MSNAKCSRTPHRDAAGNPSLEIALRCAASVVSADPGTKDHEALLTALEEELNAWLVNRAEAALQLSWALGADFLELGQLFGDGMDPGELRQLSVTLRPEARVERSYDLLFADNAPEDESHE